MFDEFMAWTARWQRLSNDAFWEVKELRARLLYEVFRVNVISGILDEPDSYWQEERVWQALPEESRPELSWPVSLRRMLKVYAVPRVEDYPPMVAAFERSIREARLCRATFDGRVTREEHERREGERAARRRKTET
jgi:hypothetical protein